MNTIKAPSSNIPINKLKEMCQFFIENNYLSPRFIHTGKIACINQFMYTAAIITLDPANYYIGYEDRWCYKSAGEALIALNKWISGDEPEGWHRHPASGRRRDNGNPLTEYINH